MLELAQRKYNWKKLIDQRTNSHWKEKFEMEKQEKTTLQYLEIQKQPLKQVHNIWKSVKHNTRYVRAGEVKTRLLSQTYMVQAKRAKNEPDMSHM